MDGYLQINPIVLRRLGCSITRVALVSPSQLHRVARGLLHVFAQELHLRALLFVCRRDMHRQQVAQGVHSHMDLAATLAFVAVVACAWTALAARLQCAPIHHHGTGLALASLRHPNDGAQVRHHRLETARIQPAPTLLVDRFPGRQIIGQHPPRCSCANQPTQSIEDLAQIMLALGSVLVHQGQVGRSEVPFFIADVRRVGLAGHPQTLPLASRSRNKVHNTL